MKYFTKSMTFAAAMMIAAGAANVAAARDIRAAPGFASTHPASFMLYKELKDFLPEETNGELNITLVGPEVVDARGMKAGLDSGLVELGHVLPLYFPADFPVFASFGDLSLLGENGLVMAAAATEYLVTCQECQQELTAAGLVAFTANSTDSYVLLTTKPVRSLADLQGMRLRSGGAPFSRWAESVGATPVNIQLGETFEAMSQGVVDGSISSVNDLLSVRLIDVTKYITTIGIGTYTASTNFALKKSVWDELTLDQRKGFVSAADKAATYYVDRGFVGNAAVAVEKARAAGIEVIEPSEDLVEHTSQYQLKDIEIAAQIAKERFGVSDPEEKIARYRELIAKWERIVEETGGDPDKLVEARQREIWSKVDLATYGE